MTLMMLRWLERKLRKQNQRLRERNATKRQRLRERLDDIGCAE